MGLEDTRTALQARGITGLAMVSEKIEPRLAEELLRVKAAGKLDYKISVIIHHESPTGEIERRDLTTDQVALNERQQVEQQRIRSRLIELGFSGEIQTLRLANALEVQLTVGQILGIAELPNVKFIVWNREEKVTA